MMMMSLSSSGYHHLHSTARYHVKSPPLRLPPASFSTASLFLPSSSSTSTRTSSLLCYNDSRPRTSTSSSSSSGSTSSSITSSSIDMVDCVGTGSDVECVPAVVRDDEVVFVPLQDQDGKRLQPTPFLLQMWDSALLVSPFFFWGTAMVAMKEVLPRAGPFFVSSFRLIPAGLLLIGFASLRGRKLPSGFLSWLSILLFAAVDAACFQGFLAEGLQKTSAGMGSVIIDSQPLTVAVLASLLYGESIGVVGAAGLVVGVIGLLLLEVPSISLDGGPSSLWGSGEWWMFLAAQSMAVGTVMVRWVTKFSDPVMATGWHMVIGGLPLLAISVLNHDPALSGNLEKVTSSDILALFYTSIFGSAISYGVYFYNATRGSLTQLSSLTFITPMFASVFGFIYLGETFSPLQLVGAVVTIVAIYMVNYSGSTTK